MELIGKVKKGWLGSALVLVTAVLLAAPVSDATAFSNSSIASIAERYPDGSRQGQCIIFVKNVLRAASNGRVVISAYTSGYQGTYKANGGKLVTNRAHAVRGDIIQVTPAGTADSWKGPEHSPLHTAIVRKYLGGGTFAVIDSNARYDERVLRHNYNPYSRGGTVKIWRMGSVPSRPKPPTKAAPPGHGDSTGAYFPWDGSWHLRNELSSGPSEYAFKRGRDGIIPVVGDWNGDGKDSTGAYFPWDGSWHLRNELSSGPSEYAFKRGRDGIIPVVGDWNGR